MADIEVNNLYLDLSEIITTSVPSKTQEAFLEARALRFIKEGLRDFCESEATPLVALKDLREDVTLTKLSSQLIDGLTVYGWPENAVQKRVDAGMIGLYVDGKYSYDPIFSKEEADRRIKQLQQIKNNSYTQDASINLCLINVVEKLVILKEEASSIKASIIKYAPAPTSRSSGTLPIDDVYYDELLSYCKNRIAMTIGMASPEQTSE